MRQEKVSSEYQENREMCVFHLFVIDMCWRLFPITFYFQSICQIFISTRVFSFSTLGRGLGHSSLESYPQGLFCFYPWVLSSEPVFGDSEPILRLWDASEPFCGDSLIYYNFGLVFSFVPNLVIYFFCVCFLQVGSRLFYQ